MKKKVKHNKPKSLNENAQKAESLVASGMSQRKNVQTNQTAKSSGEASTKVKGKSIPVNVVSATSSTTRERAPIKTTSVASKTVRPGTRLKSSPNAKQMPDMKKEHGVRRRSSVQKIVTLKYPLSPVVKRKGHVTRMKAVAEKKRAEMLQVSGISTRPENFQIDEIDSPPQKKQKQKTRMVREKLPSVTKMQQPCSSKQKKPHPAAVESWPVLSQDAKDYLSTVFELSILSVLGQKLPRKEDSQLHLNRLKQRFLARCENLRAPEGVVTNLKSLSYVHSEERAKLSASEAKLHAIEEETDKTTKLLERISEETESLEEKIRLLSDRLEEAATDQVDLQQNTGVLQLPDLPVSSIEAPLLQEKLLKIPNSCAVLQDLIEIQKSKDMKNMLIFLEQAYEEVD
ncbi:centromere protein Q isoform X1 [Protopterus annectens]|uniref:centromere protein Q isoform X1 n=1 Tax=Protopterus annectens TaxID=7888 RepID=UPI001CFABD45|nr:centromere protein Q isoform X1 [Protopterus annectens]XP_043939999.1 centromere protein Q isoform X1 [Protopterus annectens]XP_043940000.1 centromere protein Q isoform X1 [Protopterus annectens]